MSDITKILSQNPQKLEEKILKAIFKRQEAIVEVMDIVKENFFSIPDYSYIYKAMLELVNSQENITLENVQLWLEQNNIEVEQNLLLKLYHESYTSQKVRDTAKNLKELYLRRYMLTRLREVLDQQEQTPTSSTDVLSIINDIAMESNEIVSTTEKDTKCCSNKNDILADIIKKLENKNRDLGLQTNLTVIDNSLGGLKGGKLWAIVADSQVGKSAFALQLALQASLTDPNIVTTYYSLEMDKDECTERLLAGITDIEPRFISDPIKYFNRFDKSTGKIYNTYEQNKNSQDVQEYKTKISKGLDILGSLNFYIDDTPDLDIVGLEARIKRNHLKRGRTDIVVIDHLGILCDGSPSEVVGQMDKAYNKLKQLAKKLDCTIIALHQFSNELKNDPLRFPNIFSLRGSSAPRHYCDIICSIYRPDVYPDVIKNNPDLKDTCQLVWQKVRYTAKPDITEMSYNGYRFNEKSPDVLKGSSSNGSIEFNDNGDIIGLDDDEN